MRLYASGRIGKIFSLAAPTCDYVQHRQNNEKATTFESHSYVGIDANAFQLAGGLKAGVFIVVIGVGILTAVVLVPYSAYARYLKWLTLSLLAYVGVIFFVHVHWAEVFRATVIPQLHHARITWSHSWRSSALRSAFISSSGKPPRKLKRYTLIAVKKP